MPEAAPASSAAAAVLDAIVRAGLTDIVLAPGSRSQALALAAAALERSGRVHLHVRIDERVAGFTALGIAAETARPVAVIVTSGTAVAELHPAVLEAHHAGVPLLLLTADRPLELHGIAANQTTVQRGIFASGLRADYDVPAPATAADAVDAASIATEAYTSALGIGVGVAPGPVHVNLAYREPLSSAPDESASPPVDTGEAPDAASGDDGTDSPLSIDAGLRTVVIAGDKAGEAAEEFARAISAPLLAEVSSGARFGPNLVAAYRELLDDADFGGRIEQAVVFGHPTLSRQIPALLRRADVATVVVGPSGGEWFDPTGGRAQRVAAVEATGAGDRAWVGPWVSASRALLAADGEAPYTELPHDASPRERGGHARAELAAVRAPVTRRSLVDAVWRSTWPHDRLVLAASRLIREADAVVPGKRIRVLANRGLAGIDGTISTALGIAIGASREPRGGVTRVLIGDIAFLHDVGALLRTPGEPVQRIQVVIGNDLGGTIFDSLEVAGSARSDDFERVLRTPRPVDLAAIASGYGWSYRLAATRADLERALTAPAAGPELVEVPLH